MRAQLRLYEISEGRLEEFIEFWRAEVLPLRREFGFVLAGAWCERASSEFAWVIAHEDFEAAELAYYESPQRAALSRDPKEFIVHAQLRLMEPLT